jgi:5-methylcytosine-specific restriction endonuclease McrA
VKTLPKLKNELQKLFNRYIRERDSKDGYFVCISCGITKETSQMNAGHFFPVKGYDGLRFDEFNVNGECVSCNSFNEGHLIGYNDNLKNKIGLKALNKLKQRAKEYKMNGYKWARFELEEMIKKYK